MKSDANENRDTKNWIKRINNLKSRLERKKENVCLKLNKENKYQKIKRNEKEKKRKR